MKKIVKSVLVVCTFISLLTLVNCNDTATKELCGSTVEVKKYECVQGTCYYVVAPDDISFEYVVKATLKAKINTTPAVQDITLTLNPSTLFPANYSPDGGLFLFGIWKQGYGWTTTKPQILFTDSSGPFNSYNTTHYEFPSFEIELVGECNETKIISADEVKEEVASFEPSSIAVSPIDAGDDLEVYLYSNNPKESINVSVTTSLGESENMSLSQTSGTTNFFEGLLSTNLSDQKGTDNDGTLNVENGTAITIIYDDALDEDETTISISVTLTVTGDLAPTCFDGIQNGDEDGIDCGGTNCEACPTCSDGMQNGDETGVDCGGSNCEACATCDDGIQNGDETGIDCGGSNCEACAEAGGLTFGGTTYEITDASYLDIGEDYILFTISRYEDVQVFSLDLAITSSTTITSETYTFGNEDFGLTGYVAIDNVAEYATITGGSVILVITPLGDYALGIDLMTDKGALTGSYTVSGGGF
jgi:hypothetical protein